MKDELIEQTRRQVADDLMYRDGIPRIAAGVFLIVTMLMALAGSFNTFIIFIPIIPGLVEGLRKRYTYPRVGYAKVRERRNARGIIIVIAVALVVGVVVALMSNGLLGFELPSRPQVYGPMSLAVAIPIILIGFALFARRKQRLPLSAILIVLFILMILFLKPRRHTVFYIVMAFGTINLIIGIYELRKFIRENPEIPDE